ncbi:MAG: family 10 glycosylhydrolase [Lachnospiraceae bacterium]|nr:family 10 glycosylhydrolase [Lachnospiraceae bacterium]
MKRFIIVTAIVLAAWLSVLGQSGTAEAGSYRVKGVWVSCFEYKGIGLYNKSESEFRANASRMLANIKASGCNTVYFHVRAFDDAIYPSSVTGWSKYMTKGGAALSYDPLKILVSYAHQYGLSFHAWMNPYRVTSNRVLNPGKKKTIDRIVSQVQEIIDRYNVDGIHFDDYFYPTNEKKYNKVKKQTKKDNVNAMVRQVYQTVKRKSNRLVFGISPAGSLEYCDRIGADVRTWMSNSGYVDYLVPQIYWSNQYMLKGKKTALFNSRLAQWQSLNTRDIPMYAGLALYKAGRSVRGDNGWKNSSYNIASQLKQIKAGNTEGYVLFSYTDLYRSSAGKEMKHYLETIGRISLNKRKKKTRAGKKFQLRATANPSRFQNGIRWKSANKKIATVNKKGVVKAKKKGKVRIYAVYGTIKKSCLVKVRAKKSRRSGKN